MTITRRLQAFSIAAVLLSLVGILASCGGSTATGSTGGSLPTHATINIPKADRFEPFLLEIAAGGTVTWTNQDADGHTIVSMPTDPVDFKLLAMSGKSVSETFTLHLIAGKDVLPVGLAARAVLAGENGDDPLLLARHPSDAKGLVLITAATVAYGYLMKPLGLVVATAALVFISAFGGHEFKWREVAVLYIILIIFSVLVFVKGLTLPFPLWPEYFS